MTAHLPSPAAGSLRSSTTTIGATLIYILIAAVILLILGFLFFFVVRKRSRDGHSESTSIADEDETGCLDELTVETEDDFAAMNYVNELYETDSGDRGFTVSVEEEPKLTSHGRQRTIP
jgi:hypothetical protein